MPTGPAPASSNATGSVGPLSTMGGNPTHDNVRPSRLQLPLERAWVRDMNRFYAEWMASGVPVPLAVDGILYLRDRYRLYAFHEDTGAPVWDPVPVADTYYAGELAYDAGRLFLGTKLGVDAYDAATGSKLWTGVAGGVEAAPVALDGVVYYSSSEFAVVAVDQADGHVLWRSSVPGTWGPPAVDEDTVYAGYSCDQHYAFDRTTGATRWHSPLVCSGSGTTVPVVRGNRVWMGKHIRDTRTGAVVGTHPSNGRPSFWEGLTLSVEAPTTDSIALVARDSATGTFRWSFAGDGKLATAPMVSNGVVYMASLPGGVWALDPATGGVLWSDHVQQPLAYPGSTRPGWNLAVADHHLVLTAGSSIYAWRTQGPPAPIVPPPTVAAVDPPTGPSSGMNTVRITGNGFTDATRVRIGWADALSFVVCSDTLIEAVILPQDIGAEPSPYPADVVVTGPGGESATGASTKYTHTFVPHVYEVLGRHGPPLGGTGFRLRGKHFSGATKVLVGGLPAVFVLESDTDLWGITPPGLPGPAPVQVVTPAGRNADFLHSRFFYDHPPSVTGVTPNRGSSEGGTSIRLTGSGFTEPRSLAIGEREPRWDSIIDDGTVFVTTRYYHAPGTVHVTVSNASGSSLETDDNEFTYEPPPPSTTTTKPTTTTTITTTAPSGTTASSGYWMVSDDGRIYPFGDARHHGDAVLGGGARAVHIESSRTGKGYWVVDDRGGVHAFGDAVARGGNPALHAGELVASLSATRDGGGYWLFTTAGRALPYGNAVSYGDMSGRSLNGLVRRSIRSQAGNGYYMVAADGGVFAYGDATYRGSMGGRPLNGPVVGLAPTPAGGGYWLVADDGGIFSFDAPFRGSMGGRPLNRPVVGMVAYGDGYLMVASDGGIFNFSSKPFHGSLGTAPPPRPITAVAVLPFG